MARQGDSLERKMLTRRWARTRAQQFGLNYINSTSKYDVIGDTTGVPYTPNKRDISDIAKSLHKGIEQELVEAGGKNLYGGNIYKSINAGSFYRNNPQDMLAQIVGKDALEAGTTVFGFDLETLGVFDGKANRGFAITEIAIVPYRFDPNAAEIYSPTQSSSKKLIKYFQQKDEGVAYLFKDSQALQYYRDIASKMKGKRTYSLIDIDGVESDDIRSLISLIRLGGDAKFSKDGRILSHNTASIPITGVLTQRHVDYINQALDNIDRYGLEINYFLDSVNQYIHKNIDSKHFKILSFNGLAFDQPVLQHVSKGRYLSLLNDIRDSSGNIISRYSGHLDILRMATSFYNDPVGYIYGGAKGLKRSTLQLEQIGKIFGLGGDAAHTSLYDTQTLGHAANLFFEGIRKHYYDTNGNPLPKVYGVPGMASYDTTALTQGTRMYARAGLVKYGDDSIFDTVFRFEKDATGKISKVQNMSIYPTSINRGVEYVYQGIMHSKLGDDDFFTAVLYNVDEDMYHTITRRSESDLASIIQKHFMYGDTKGDVDIILSDRARRRYLELFSVDSSHKPGYTHRQFEKYMSAVDIVDEKIKNAALEELQKELGPIVKGNPLDTMLPKWEQKMMDALSVSENKKMIMDATGMTEAEYRDFMYMYHRLESEKPVLNKIRERLNDEKLNDLQRDLALKEYRGLMDETFGQHLERIQPLKGQEQMFIYSHADNAYTLVNISRSEDLALGLTNVIGKAKNPVQSSSNALQIIYDLHRRGYIDAQQTRKLETSINSIFGTQVDNPRLMQEMAELADTIIQMKEGNVRGFKDRVASEFDAAEYINQQIRNMKLGHATEVSLGGGSHELTYFKSQLAGGVHASYERESMRHRNIGDDILDRFLNPVNAKKPWEIAVDRAIVSDVFSTGIEVEGGGVGKWTREALEFFNEYDKSILKRINEINPTDKSIDFTRRRRPFVEQLDDLAKQFEDSVTGVRFYMSQDKRTVNMLVYSKDMADRVVAMGGEAVRSGEFVTLSIPLTQPNNTFVDGSQVKVSQLFLNVRYGAKNPSIVTDVYAEDMSERILRGYRINANVIKDYMRVYGVDDTNRLVKRLRDKRIAEASGSGHFVSNLLQENKIDATNRATTYLRANYVNVTGLTGLYNLPEYDTIYGDELQTFYRQLSRDISKYNINLGFNAVKGPTVLGGIISKINAASLEPFGSFLPMTKDNAVQIQNYYNLGDYKQIAPMVERTYRIAGQEVTRLVPDMRSPIDRYQSMIARHGEEGTRRLLSMHMMTETAWKLQQGELEGIVGGRAHEVPGLMVRATFVTDEQIARAMQKAVEAGVVSPFDVPTTYEGMGILDRRLAEDFGVLETKVIKLEQGIEPTEEMRKLLEQVQSNPDAIVVIDPAEYGGKFTVGKAIRSNGGYVDYTDKEIARVVGMSERNAKGDREIILEKYLPVEQGTKFAYGSQKLTANVIDMEKILPYLDNVDPNTQLLVVSEASKNASGNDVIAGFVNRVLSEAEAEARRQNKLDQYYSDVVAAFNDVFGISAHVEQKKLTIGDVTTNTVVISDLVDPNSYVNAIGADGKRLEPGKVNSATLAAFAQRFSGYGVNISPNQLLSVDNILRRLRVSTYPKAFGYNVGPDEGVKYGFRELEMLRSKRIVIDGKAYGPAPEVVRWVEGSILDRATTKWATRMDISKAQARESIARHTRGMAMALYSGGGLVSPGAGDNIITLEQFKDMKRIDSLKDFVDKSQLSGTILDPLLGTSGENQGFWLELPFEVHIRDAQGKPVGQRLDKIFMYQDNVQVVGDTLQATPIQKHQLAIEKNMRAWINANNQVAFINNQKVKLTNAEARKARDTAAEGLKAAVSEYIREVGKALGGSHGVVADTIGAARLGSSAQFTVGSMNVFMEEMVGKALNVPDLRGTDVLISKEYMLGMLEGSGLSQTQIEDIINYAQTDKGLLAFANRYPTIDQGGTNAGRLRLLGNLSGDRAVFTLGQQVMLKADMDGDHASVIMPQLNKYLRDVNGKDILYSDMMAVVDQQMNRIKSGEISLSNITGPVSATIVDAAGQQKTITVGSESVRFFTEFAMMAESDAQRAETVGKWFKAQLIAEPNLPFTLENIDSIMKGDMEQFLSTDRAQMLLNREARIMKQVGPASNLNAKMRRFVESLVNTPNMINEPSLSLVDAASEYVAGNLIVNSFLADISDWDAMSTLYTIQEQSGISAKKLRDRLKQMDIDMSNITPEQEQMIFESMNNFMVGLRTLDVDKMRQANRELKLLNIKDFFRLGSGAFDEEFGEVANILTAGDAEIARITGSLRKLNQTEDTIEDYLIGVVEKLKPYSDAIGGFSSNTSLKMFLSEPRSAYDAVTMGATLYNTKSGMVVPTYEFEWLLDTMDEADRIDDVRRSYIQRMNLAGINAFERQLGLNSDNFNRFTRDGGEIYTVGADTLNETIGKIFKSPTASQIGTSVAIGAGAFAAVWAVSAMFRSSPVEKEMERPVEDQAPSSDGTYVDPAIFGPAPSGAGPTARISRRGTGYESIQVNINAQNTHGWSEKEIEEVVRRQLSEQMPVQVNMNTNRTDSTTRIDRQWVQDVVTKALKHGFAF